jgi:hypothetical protein
LIGGSIGISTRVSIGRNARSHPCARYGRH